MKILTGFKGFKGLKIKFAGFGFNFHRSFRGNDLVLGSNIEWQWCLRLDYRAPWDAFGGWHDDGDRWHWRHWWCQHYFYFGRTHTEHAPGFERYQRVSRTALIHGHGWGWS